MSPVMLGKIVRLTVLISNEQYKKKLSVFFSYTLPYIEIILGTSICRNRYGPHTEMGIASYDNSCP